jgi:poly-gamma-glutamate synthesis protein (capsule biosynthesis protein)
MKIIGIVFAGAIFAASVWLYSSPEAAVPVGIVVPHHDMVAATRAAYLSQVASLTKPETIIIVSPDHFNAVTAPIVTSDRRWQTSAGEILPDNDLIDRLGLTIQNEPFPSEHGITSLLKDIRQNFSHSTLVPILLSRSATYTDVVQLTVRLYEECPRCLLVASVDFSHTNDAMVADLHDILTLRELLEVDSEALYKDAEVDSPESLIALTTWAILHNHRSFSLFSQTNSGFLSGTRSGEMTTHLIGGYYPGEAKSRMETITFMAAGDLLLSRGVHHHLAKQPRALEKLGERFFWGVDVSLVNFEGYFSDAFDQSVWTQEPPLFPVYSTLSKYLDYLRITTVNLANNHSADGGASGFAKTLQELQRKNISVIGDTANIAESTVLIEEIGGVKVAFIGVYTHRPFSNLIETIEKLSQSDHHVVVYAHWGEEFATVSNAVQQQMARDWIDAGADMILGSHPHVVQEFAVYKGRPIAYSLGNFIFDQNGGPDVQVGAVVGGKFDETSLSIFLVPIHTYLEPSVIAHRAYNNYVQEWTAPWSQYQHTDGYFTFSLREE